MKMFRKIFNIRDIGLLLLTVFVILFSFFVIRNLYNHPRPSQDETLPLYISKTRIVFESNSGGYITIRPRIITETAVTCKIRLSDPKVLDTIKSFIIPQFSSRPIFVPVHSRGIVGYCTISLDCKNPKYRDQNKVAIDVQVVWNNYISVLSFVIGWSYFFAWSVSYYPQIYKNWKRKSVVGLSFDYVLLNIIGHVCYMVFNANMYWNPFIQKLYFQFYPVGEIPVKLNDNFFSIHAVSMTLLTIYQCFIYERGDQRLSVPFIALATGCLLIIGSGLVSVFQSHITWLGYLYLLSYIKVGVTPLKYIPQAYLNYIRQSTEGFAIFSVSLDFIGSVLSLLQATVDSINSGDFHILFGNPGKLALSCIGMMFNILYISQYFLYKGKSRPKRSHKDSISLSYELLPAKSGITNSSRKAIQLI